MIRAVICVAAVAGSPSFASNALWADEAAASREANELVGTWKLVSASYGGRESDLPKRLTMLKHVTPTHFLWTRIDSDTGQIVAAAGGTYSLGDGKYTETPEFGTGRDFQIIRDKPHTFTWKVEGDKWHHSGELANGLPISEVWERVKGEN